MAWYDVYKIPIEWGKDAYEYVRDVFIPDYPDPPTYEEDVPERQTTTTVEGYPIPLAYGEVEIGSNILRSNDEDETTEKFIFSHCVGPIQSIDSVKINDTAWGDIPGTPSKTHYTGTKTQTANAGGGSFSVNPCAYRGIAYTYASWDSEEFSFGGTPNMVVGMKAKKCCYLAEDYSLFTEADPNSRIEKTDSEITFTGIQRDESAYISHNKLVGYFSEDFDHYQELYIDSASANLGRAVCWGVANSGATDFFTIADNNGAYLGVMAHATATDFNLLVTECDAGALTTQTKSGLSFDTTYYLHIKRDEAVGAFGTLYVYIYTDVERTTLVDTVTLTLAKKANFQYLYSFSSWGDNAGAEAITGVFGCIDLGLTATTDANRLFSRNNGTIMWDVTIDIEGYAEGECNRHWFKELKKYCDAWPTGASAPRYRFDFFWREPKHINDIKKVLWHSFRGRTIRSQGEIKPVWERTKTSVHSFDVTNIVKGSFDWSQPERANKVRLYYRDPDRSSAKAQIELIDEYSIEVHGEILKEIKCNYITEHEVAKRRLQLEFDKVKYTEYQCNLIGFSDSGHLEVFDLVDVTHVLPGFTSKNFIVKNVSPDQYGRVGFKLEEYYAGIYHDREADVQSGSGIDLPNPWAVLSHPTNIALTAPADDGNSSFQSHANLTFTPTPSPFWSHAEVWISLDDATYEYFGIDVRGTGLNIYGSGQSFIAGDTIYVKLVAVTLSGIKEDIPGAADDSVAITAPHQIGNFFFSQYDMYGGNVAIGNAATVVVVGNMDGTPKIALGTSADAIDVAGTSAGFIVDGDGKLYLGDAANAYLKFDAVKLTWKGANTELDASGNLTCTGGTIGGWTLSNTQIYSTNVWITSSGANSGLHIGSQTYGEAGIQLEYYTFPDPDVARLYVGDGAGDYFKYDGTNVEMSLSKAGAAITLKSGTDIELESESGDTAELLLEGNARLYSFGADFDNDRLCLYTDSDGSGDIRIGTDYSNAAKRPDNFVVGTKHAAQADIIHESTIDADHVAWSRITGLSGGSSYCELHASDGTDTHTVNVFPTKMTINNPKALGGDVKIVFQLSSNNKFAMGVDNDDGDSFKISGGDSLGANDRLVITQDSLLLGADFDADTFAHVTIYGDSTPRILMDAQYTATAFCQIDMASDSTPAMTIKSQYDATTSTYLSLFGAATPYAQLRATTAGGNAYINVYPTYIDVSDEFRAKTIIKVETMKRGANQGAAGAAADELWATDGHSTLPDHVVIIGV